MSKVSVKVGVTSYDGYVSECFFKKKSIMADCRNPGIAVEAFRIFQTLLHPQFDFQLVSLQEYQNKLGPWLAIEKAMNESLIDMGLDLWQRKEHNLPASVRFLHFPLIYTNLVYYFHSSSRRQELSRFQLPLYWECYLGFVGLGLLISLLLRNFRFFPSLLLSLLQPSSIDGILRRKSVLLLLPWMWGGTFFMSWYGAVLKTDMALLSRDPFRTTPQLAKQISTRQLNYYVVGADDEWLDRVQRGESSFSGVLNKAFAKNPPRRTGTEHLAEVVRTMEQVRGFVAAADSVWVRLLQRAVPDSACEIRKISAEDKSKGGLHLVFLRDFPYMTQMENAGAEANQMMHNVLHRVLRMSNRCKSHDKHMPLNLHFFHFALLYFGLGIALSTLSFTAEYIICHWLRIFEIV